MSGGKDGGSQVTGYRYYFGIHMGIGRGPVDELCEIKVGDRTAWSGSAKGSASISINQPDLFGGEKKEGGIQGTFDLMMGTPQQVPFGGVRKLYNVDVPVAITFGGLLPSANGTYTKVTTNTSELEYRRTDASGVVWRYYLETTPDSPPPPIDEGGG